MSIHDNLAHDFSLAGRVAVVTGAASGIGRETARVLAEAGARIVMIDIDEAGMAATADLAPAAGGAAIARRADVTDRAAIEAVADETVQALGRLDIWVNAAGVLLNGGILAATEADFDHVVAVNQKGVFWGCAAAGRVMRPQGRGSIVNISSAGADIAAAEAPIYAMTKAAVSVLTRAAARDFAAFGVRVNAVAPGVIDTPMVTRGFRNAAGEVDPQIKAEAFKQIAKMSPLGLVGTPRDVGLSILYLASDASRFTTGQVLRPNGGMVMPY